MNHERTGYVTLQDLYAEYTGDRLTHPAKIHAAFRRAKAGKALVQRAIKGEYLDAADREQLRALMLRIYKRQSLPTSYRK